MNKYSPIPEQKPYTLPKIAPEYNHVHTILTNLNEKGYYDYCFSHGNLIMMNNKYQPIRVIDFNEQIQIGIWNF
jgi:hypothetical protein